MTYKIHRESRLPNIDLHPLIETINKHRNSYKNRHASIYFDAEHLWFRHNEKRKRVSFSQIKSVQKAGLHGFGSMINIVYKSNMRPTEDGKPVDLHLVDVESHDQSPEDLAKTLTKMIENSKKNEKSGRRIHKFPGHDDKETPKTS